MEPAPKPKPLIWYCVLDRNMHQLYLGTDEPVSRRVAIEGAITCSGESMGDAMKQAAIKWGESRRGDRRRVPGSD